MLTYPTIFIDLMTHHFKQPMYNVIIQVSSWSASKNFITGERYE